MRKTKYSASRRPEWAGHSGLVNTIRCAKRRATATIDKEVMSKGSELRKLDPLMYPPKHKVVRKNAERPSTSRVDGAPLF
jgi:hypothetical protein